MKIQTSLMTAAILFALAPSAFAQQPAAGAPPPPLVKQGPAIPGMCTFSQGDLVANSKVGQYAQQRYTQISAQVNSEINQIAATLAANQRDLLAQVNATGQDANAAGIAAYQQKVADFQNLSAMRNDQLQRTKDGAIAQVLQATSSFMQNVYETHNCSLLIDGDTLLVPNPAMDITPSVVTLLDQKMTTLQFDLAPPPQQQQGAAAGGAPAAAPAATPAPAATTPARAPAARTPAGPARAPAR